LNHVGSVNIVVARLALVFSNNDFTIFVQRLLRQTNNEGGYDENFKVKEATRTLKGNKEVGKTCVIDNSMVEWME